MQPDFVGFYRWHVADPVVFREELRVTIQQIGFAFLRTPEDAEAFQATHDAAGRGWDTSRAGVAAAGIYERVDDYCAASFVYCREPQAVPRLDVAAAIAEIERKAYERRLPFERGVIG